MIGLRLLACMLFLATSSAMGAILSEGEVLFVDDNVTVGDQQDGALSITPPDVLATNFLSIAQGPGVVGTVLIDGAGITSQNGLSIGSQGIGTLTIQNGGQFTQSLGGTTIGSSGMGRLEVLGSGSTADLAGESGSTSLFAGGSGPFRSRSHSRSGSFARGEILVSQGGELSTGSSTFGINGLTETIIEGNGSLWRSQGETNFGNGELVLRDGARWIHSGSSFRQSIQFGAFGGTSSVLISGEGSLLSSNQEILIGESGQAVVRVEGGADVTADSTTLGVTRSGRYDGPQRGILELDGFGTTWRTNSLLLAGNEGEAEIRITGGAVLNVIEPDQVILGAGQDSTAIVTIDGPNSQWNLTGNTNLKIGDGGYGELRITGGAHHESDFVEIGQFGPGADGKVIVSGAGSHWNVQDYIQLIRGEILVSDGASMQIPGNFGIFTDGNLRLDGGELLRSTTSFLIDNQGQISGDGTIEALINNFSTGSIYVGPNQLLEIDSIENEGLVVIEEGVMKLSEYLANEGQIRIEKGKLRTAGSLTNEGQIVIEEGELRVERRFYNRGQLDLSNATLRSDTSSGLLFTNISDSEMRFLGGDNRVERGFSNRGRLIVRGNSTVTFFDVVANHDFFSVSTGSTAYFLDSFIGLEGIFGDGQVVFEGETRFRNDVTFSVDMTFTASATLRIGISEGEPNAFSSTGIVDLGGELEIGGGPLSEPGLHELTIIEAALIEDTFDFLPEIDSLIGSRTLYRGIEYNDTSVVLLVEQLAAGDYNGDGLVDAADYDAWAGAFGTSGTSLADGNSDGIVDAADYTLWRDAMEDEQPATVPEPTGLAVCALLCFALTSQISRAETRRRREK